MVMFYHYNNISTPMFWNQFYEQAILMKVTPPKMNEDKLILWQVKTFRDLIKIQHNVRQDQSEPYMEFQVRKDAVCNKLNACFL